MITVRLVGAAIGVAVGLLLAAALAVAFGVTIPMALLGGLWTGLPPAPPLEAVSILAGVFWLLVTQVIGWYAIASLSIRTAIAGTVLVAGAPTVISPNLVESFARGYCIGLNAGLNVGLWSVLLHNVSPAVGLAVGLVAGGVNVLAAIGPLAATAGFKTVIGWSSWLMPMSWLATGIGLGLFFINRIMAPISGMGPVTVRLDGTTGIIESAGGITGSLGTTGWSGFNLGNFTFVRPGAPTTGFTVPGVSAHEAGHGLNVAAFGSIWHLLGNAIEQNVPPFKFERCAYAEMLTQSHLPMPNRRTLLQWS